MTSTNLNFSFFGLFVMLLSLAVIIPSASAACGDTINSSQTLAADMTCNSTAIIINASNIVIDCAGFTINYSMNSSLGYAIKNTDGHGNITITNCNIVEGNISTDYKHSIYINGSDRINISNTNITTISNNTRGILINLSSNITVDSNNIQSSGVTSSVGIYLGDSQSGTVTRNTITTSGASSYAVGYLSTLSTTISGNTLNTTGNADALCLYGNSRYNSIEDNTILEAGRDAIRFRIVSGNIPMENNISNNTIGAVRLYQLEIQDAGTHYNTLIDQQIGNYSIGNPGSIVYFKESDKVEIRFLEQINGTGDNLSSDIRMDSNLAEINSSKTGLAKQANITLYNLSTSLSNPYIIKDSNAICNEDTTPRCTAFTSLTAGNVSFNITSWSNYSIMDLPCANLSDPSTWYARIINSSGTLYVNHNVTLCTGTYALDVNSTSNAIVINDSNIYFNCSQSVIDGVDGNGTGMYLGEDDGGIYDCNITGYDNGLYINLAVRNTIQNVTSYLNTLYGMYLGSSATDTNISYGGVVNNSEGGVYIGDKSTGNNFSNLKIFYNSIGVNVSSTASNNEFILNNFTDNTLQATSANNTNLFYSNTTGVPKGNYWSDIFTNSLNITDNNSNGFAESGSDYPYNTANGGNVSGDVEDYGPIVGDIEDRYGAAVCGDSTCEGDETCSNCPLDCGVCPVGGGSGRSGSTYIPPEEPEKVEYYCGDGFCTIGEDCTSCTSDCGECKEEVTEEGVVEEVPEEEPLPDTKDIKLPKIGLEVPKVSIFSKFNIPFLFLAIFLIVGFLGYYVYAYRSQAEDAISEIDKELKKLMK